MKLELGALALAAFALAASGCSKLDDDEARKLVRTYLARVIEAYRVSDAELAAPVASDREVRKLTGLIGVKRDGGMNLDAQLLEIQFEAIERRGQEVRITARERWRYRDLQIGTGKQVGEASTDTYRLVYELGRESGRWVVLKTEFVEPPVVGRKMAPVTMDARALHGIPAHGESEEPTK
jgi:hypothetical protein